MLGLTFRIFGDSRPIQHEFDKLQAGAEKAGKKISNKFNLGYAGALSTIAIQTVRSIQEAIAESSQALKESASLKTQVEDWAKIKLLSEQTGVSQEKIVEVLKRGGVHAAQLRRSLDQTNVQAAGGTSKEAAGWMSFLSTAGSSIWNLFKMSNVNALVNQMKVVALAVDSLTGSSLTTLGLGQSGAVQSRQAEAELAAKRAEQAANREKMFKEGQQWARDDLFKQSGEFYGKRRDQIMANAPDRPTADALTRVGIGNIGGASEARNYQNFSLDLFRRIERNTADALKMKGFDFNAF